MSNLHKKRQKSNNFQAFYKSSTSCDWISPTTCGRFGFLRQKMLDNYCGLPYIKIRSGYDSVQPRL